MVLVMEPKLNGAVAKSLGVQSCFQVCGWDYGWWICHLGVSLCSQNGNPGSWTSLGFHNLLPGSQSSHNNMLAYGWMPNCCWGGKGHIFFFTTLLTSFSLYAFLRVCFTAQNVDYLSEYPMWVMWEGMFCNSASSWLIELLRSTVSLQIFYLFDLSVT